MANEEKPVSPAVQAARERLAALKAKSNKLPAEEEELAELARQEIAERKRLDKEGEEALRQFVLLKEAEAWEKLPPDQRNRASVVAAYDWPTHKRTARYEGDAIKIDSGRGVMIITALDRDAAAKAMKPAAKVGEHGVGLYDNSEEAVLRGLLKAVLYPDATAIQMICVESPAFAAAAHSQAIELSGAFARVTSGKS